MTNDHCLSFMNDHCLAWVVDTLSFWRVAELLIMSEGGGKLWEVWLWAAIVWAAAMAFWNIYVVSILCWYMIPGKNWALSVQQSGSNVTNTCILAEFITTLLQHNMWAARANYPWHVMTLTNYQKCLFNSGDSREFKFSQNWIISKDLLVASC